MSSHVTICALALLLCVVLAPAHAQICPNDVPAAIASILANCSYCDRAYFGIRVDQLEPNNTWTTLFSKNSPSYLLPASNNKLFTTISAFTEFGPNYTISTPLYMSVEGDLCLLGRGDPSISNNDLQQLAATLKNSGISQVRSVYLDDTYYQGPFLPQNWEWSDITQSWGAAPTPLMVDENIFNFNLYPSNIGDLISVNFSYQIDASLFDMVIEATTSEAGIPANIVFDIDPSSITKITVTGTLPYGSGANPYSLAVINPQNRFAELFAYALTQQQVKITGAVEVSPCPSDVETASGWKQVAAMTSPPLHEMMNYTLQVSDNIYAETFLMLLGTTITDSPLNTTRALGIQKAHSILTENFGLVNGSFIQDDGSGVSRQNSVSPDALISLLETIYFEPYADMYLSFLPVAGKSGTLIDRFVNTAAQGVLHAKTGTLDNANCLTGYIDHQNSDYPIITFSILANMGSQSLTPPIDEICVLLSTLKNC